MGIEFGREICGDLDIAEYREWLVTNGIGGYASGTVVGLLPGRYHGLLVAALKPPSTLLKSFALGEEASLAPLQPMYADSTNGLRPTKSPSIPFGKLTLRRIRGALHNSPLLSHLFLSKVLSK